MVTQIMKAETTTITGATQKMAFSAEEGMMSSFRISFRASARGCISPMGPVRVGPNRRWRRPNTLRSNHVSDITTTERKVNMTSSPMTIQAKASQVIGPPHPARCPTSRELPRRRQSKRPSANA